MVKLIVLVQQLTGTCTQIGEAELTFVQKVRQTKVFAPWQKTFEEKFRSGTSMLFGRLRADTIEWTRALPPADSSHDYQLSTFIFGFMPPSNYSGTVRSIKILMDAAESVRVRE